MDVRSLMFKVGFDGNETAVKRMDGSTNKLKKTAEGTTKKLDAMGKKFRNIGKTMTMTVTAPLIALGTAGVKMALDLDNSIRKVSTLADRDILPVDKLRKEIREISDLSGIAQTEIAESAYSALSAGVDSADVMRFVKSSIDLTRAGFTDMETAIDATTTVLNAYGSKAFDVSKIHDIFVQTQDKGKISVDELGKNIGRVIPTASSLGVNLDQLGASYAILTAQGQNATLATTNLNSMLDELGKTGSSSDKILRQKTGKGFAQLTAEGKSLGDILGIVNESAKKSNLSLKDMFGSSTAGSAAVTLLSSGVEGYNSSLEEMNSSQGKTAQNAATMEGGLLKIQKATTQVKNSLIEAGAILAPYVEKGAEFISKLTEKFNSLDDGSKKTVMTFVGIAAATGPVLILLGALISPIGLISVGIAGLTALGIGLYKNWKKNKDEAKESWNSITNSVEGSVAKIKDLWSGLKTFLKNPIKGTVDFIGKGASKLFGGTKVDGSHKTGLNRVPKDNYVANLHKDEAVLPKADAEEWRRGTRKVGNNVVYSPSVNITVGQDVGTETKRDLEKTIKNILEREREKFFYKLALQNS